MKMGSLFDLVADGNDLLSFFEDVNTAEQLVSRLERIKRRGPRELLEAIGALRASIDVLMEDTMEMSPSLEESESAPDPSSAELDAELEAIAGDVESAEAPEAPEAPEVPDASQKTNHPQDDQQSETKKDEPPTT